MAWPHGAEIDWAIPPISWNTAQALLDRLSGPAPSTWEMLLTSAGLVLSVAYALHEAQPTWTRAQSTVACLVGLIDGSAAVQCTTAQSKRWYHAGGRLSDKLHAVIAVETAFQCFLIGWMFAGGAWLVFGAVLSAWFSFCIGCLWAVPLHAQRPTATLLFLCGAALFSESIGVLPRAPGADWMPHLLAVKYLISHIPRHEPYRLAGKE